MFVALTQCIISTLASRFEIVNENFEKKLFFESRNFKENFYNQKQKIFVLTSKTRDVFAIASCRKNTNKFSFYNSKKASNIAQDKRTYYNCEKKNTLLKIVSNYLRKRK